VVALDQPQYGWSLVMGPNRDYLWILARERQLAEDVRAGLLEQAGRLGVDVGQLIWVEHSRSDG
jgi:apolipoprotein D and lipocalin family protein